MEDEPIIISLKPDMCMMDKVVRISMSLEPDLLEEFDTLVNNKGYTARSEAIRDHIRDALVEDRWRDSESEVVGTITMVYDHTVSYTQERLMEIQHSKHLSISSTIHVHLNMDQCLEVLIVWGKVKEVTHLADEIGAIKGVVFSKLTMTSGSMSHSEEDDHKHAHVHSH